MKQVTTYCCFFLCLELRPPKLTISGAEIPSIFYAQRRGEWPFDLSPRQKVASNGPSNHFLSNATNNTLIKVLSIPEVFYGIIKRHKMDLKLIKMLIIRRENFCCCFNQIRRWIKSMCEFSNTLWSRTHYIFMSFSFQLLFSRLMTQESSRADRTNNFQIYTQILHRTKKL